MAYKIHAIPAADAAGMTAPYDGTAEAVFVDSDGNPVDVGAGGGTVGPATQTTAGVVKKTATITALATSATLPQVVAWCNDLLAKGKAAGFFG